MGDVSHAAKLFKDMGERGVDPDIITYSMMIKAYAVQGDMKQAIQLFGEMRKRGVEPDTKAYTTIIEGCLRKGDLEAAVRFVDDAMGLDAGAPGLSRGGAT